MFNKLLQQGYSASLSTRVIHALHKGGDASQFENYRGITVGSVLAKVFAMILEARLNNWAEERGLWARGQVGFRKDFRTTDNLYILRTLIEQSAHKRKKVYCCFVDFRKAFDTVPRDLLWQVLAKMGIVGRFIQCLQSMYNQDNVRVMHPTEGLLAQFSCGIGVKQGCPLSPLLFGFYLDGLEKHLDAFVGDSSPQLADTIIKVLLYADDLAFMSETPQGLQKQIDALSEFCVKRQLVINVSKTEVVVFEKCRNAAPEFTYRGTTIKRVQSFRYLGLELHSTRGMVVAIDKLTDAGKKALFALRRKCNDLSITDPEVMCQLFDSLVRPVLSYACEVWTSCTGAKGLQQVKQVHRMFLRGILGVNKTTSIFVVLGEFERYPLEYFWWQQTLKYYDRLWESTPDRVLYCAYQTQLQMLNVFNDNQQCWLRNVQLWLDKQRVGVLYINVKCTIASAQASYLESTYGEQARTISSRLRTYQLMNMSCKQNLGTHMHITVICNRSQMFSSGNLCQGSNVPTIVWR